MKIGDKVKIREDLVGGNAYGDIGFVSYMERYRGKVYEIASITPEDNFILKTGDDWVFSKEMLVKEEEIKIGDIVEFEGNRKRIFGEVLRETDGYPCNWIVGNNIKDGGHPDIKGWKYGWYTSDAKPVKLIVHCPTQAEFNKVNELFGGELIESCWEGYKKNTAINSAGCYSRFNFYKSEEEYKDYTFITASELLGTSKKNVTEELKELDLCLDKEATDILRAMKSNKKPTVNKLKEKTMKILKTFKNALLSKDEKLLRKHNLKTDCGDFTDEAWEILKLDYANKNNDVLVKAAEEADKEE